MREIVCRLPIIARPRSGRGTVRAEDEPVSSAAKHPRRRERSDAACESQGTDAGPRFELAQREGGPVIQRAHQFGALDGHDCECRVERDGAHVRPFKSWDSGVGYARGLAEPRQESGTLGKPLRLARQ